MISPWLVEQYPTKQRYAIEKSPKLTLWDEKLNLSAQEVCFEE